MCLNTQAPKTCGNALRLNTTSCLGTCENGPSVLVYPEGVMYEKVSAEDVNVIIDKHLLGGKPVESLKISKDLWE